MAQAKLKVRFGYFAESQPFQMGLANRYFDQLGYEVLPLRLASGGRAIIDLANDALDISILGSTPYALGVARGVDMIALAVVHSKGRSQGLVTKPDIRSPGDLTGKVLGTPFTSTAHLHALFLRELLNMPSLNIIHVSPSDMVDKWESGEIDAAYCWGGALNALLNTAQPKGTMILEAETLTKWGAPIFNVIVARRQFAEEHGEYLQKFMQVYAAIDKSYIESPQDWGTGCLHAAFVASSHV